MVLITEIMIGVNILISLFVVIQKSRCTEIRSSCCCCDIEIERDVINPSENSENEDIATGTQVTAGTQVITATPVNSNANKL